MFVTGLTGLIYCLVCRPDSGAAAGLAERNSWRSQESSVPRHPAALWHRAPDAGPQPPTRMPQPHYLPESEQKEHKKTGAFLTVFPAVQMSSLLLELCLLQEDDEFRDKLTPISLALNYSLAPPSSGHDLPPVLNHYSSTLLLEHVSASYHGCI